ncbi:hypothetical protein COCOBI_16-0570 [Coccomyxa sp. Obi]|nr:hypothetical protein COCOBI_16-0570 [Coccomyxa sp. Obi]
MTRRHQAHDGKLLGEQKVSASRQKTLGDSLININTGAMAERASSFRTPPWIELPAELWAVIGCHLGTRDLARASTVIKMLGGVQPLALNLAHTLTNSSKIGELVWGLKHSNRVLSAVIRLKSSQKLPL